MLDDLIIANLRPDCGDTMPTALGKVQWQTCLRRIVFLQRTELSLLRSRVDPGTHFYRGQQAYQFLLEVICGLHSPLLGETAVMGQFRSFRASAEFPSTAWGRYLRKLTTDLLVDARYIRHQHLQSLGSQSYGSLIRKQLKSCTRVALLGTGSLAQEILPWLLDGTEVRVFYRSWSHAEHLQEQHKQVQFEQFTRAKAVWKSDAGALVITAPLKSNEVHTWLELQGVSLSLIIDLRGNATTDPMNVSQPLIKLSELFESLSYERWRLDTHKRAAFGEIESIARHRYKPAERLCA